MFGLNNITLGIIAALIIANIATFTMWRWSEGDYEAEKVLHHATKVEFDSYKKQSEDRIEELQKASAKAALEAQKRLDANTQRLKKSEADVLKMIKENETLRKRTVSNELVGVLNAAVVDRGESGQPGQAAEGTTARVNGTPTTFGEVTEFTLAEVVTRNTLKCEHYIDQLLALQEWATGVCQEAGCS